MLQVLPSEREVAGTLDCLLRQPAKVWLQIHAGLFVFFLSFSLHENKSYFLLVFININPEELT